MSDKETTVQRPTLGTIAWNLDGQGIVDAVLDSGDSRVNVLTPALVADLDALVSWVRGDSAVMGVIIRSSKPVFVAGADVTELAALQAAGMTLREGREFSRRISGVFRRLETCGKPFVALLEGSALGGGLELALACHRRIAVDDRKVSIGLPEVGLGLLPGAGGTQRLPRLVGIARATRLLLDGAAIGAREAHEAGLVHELVASGEARASAVRWLTTAADPVAPWDVRGFRIPGGGGVMGEESAQAFCEGTALAAHKTWRCLPAHPAILSAVFEGSLLPMDAALEVESRYFARLVSGPVSRNLIRTQFINKRSADGLVSRPRDVGKRVFRHLAVVGVGMMGRGIGFMAASAGIGVTFLDSTPEAAREGPAFARRLLEKQVAAGRRRPEEVDQVLGRMSVTVDHRDLAACDIVVEAVFEDREVKRDVWTRLDAVMPADAVLASNTSSLPITGLAGFVRDPSRFIGLHFFSPVERMPLVEVIRGGATSEATLAHALDFVGQLRKTPIVVNDSRGFFTSRVFLSYCHEGQAMLAEGISPALIENAARLGGMSVGPLAVTDEVSSELQWHLIRQAEEDLGAAFVPPVSYEVLRRFVTVLGRPGRKAGRGFYDYPAGAPKRLWPGLSEQYPPAAVQPDVAEVRDRLLFIQTLEAARCLDEGVIASAAEADLGSVLGIGFPAWTGGVVSFVETYGAADFMVRARKLSRSHGGRFAPSPWLAAYAQRFSGEMFREGAR